MIFLPIKPKYAFAIRDEKKLVEFRKVSIKNAKSNVCVVYASSPYKKIIGHFEFKAIDEGHPNVIWEKYKKIGGVKKSDYNDYYKNSKKAYAIQISKFIPIKTPVHPIKKIKRFTIPQSFRYLTESEFQTLLAC